MRNHRNPGPRGADRSARSETFEIFTRPQRSLAARVLGLSIRLRAEITTLAIALAVWLLLAERMPAWGASTTLAATALVLAAVPRSRCYVTRRGLAVLTRHRLRAVFVERRVMNWTGNLPVLLWSRPTAVGERVWVVLRAGINVADIERNLPYIASGCLARNARVSVQRSITALVQVDVIRRDPLTARTTTTTTSQALRARPALRLITADQKGA